jgi:hypothetical protein
VQEGWALPLRGDACMHDFVMAGLPGACGPTYMLEAVLTHALDELVLSDGAALLKALHSDGTAA